MNITPTVGRVMWFYPDGANVPVAQQPLSAQVAHVNEDGTVNIGFLTMHGNHDSRINVRVVQEGEPPYTDLPFVCWLPYQVEVAKKAAAA